MHCQITCMFIVFDNYFINKVQLNYNSMSNLGFFCPEYDEKRGKIQENYDFRCPGLINASVLIYRSSQVFHCKCI